MEINELVQVIGQNIKWEREQRGITQEELAAKCKQPISRHYISVLERGKAPNPGTATILSIANALEVEARYLLSPRGVAIEDANNYPELIQKLTLELSLGNEEVEVLKAIRINGYPPESEEVYRIFIGLLRCLNEQNGEQILGDIMRKLVRKNY